MRLVPIALALVLGLSACQTSGVAPRPEAKLIAACRAYTETLNSLAVMRRLDQLSASDIEAVNTVRTIVNPICGAEAPLTDAAVGLDDVEAGLYRLIEIEEASR